MTIASEPVDRQALLCALVLAPATFARNRFFSLFTEPWARRTRARAAQLRAIVRHLAHEAAGAQLRELLPLENGGVALRYGLPRISLERTAMLDRLEIALVRFALSRKKGAASEAHTAMLLTEEDRAWVEGALAKLGRKLGLVPLPETRSDHHPTPTTGDS